MHWIAWIPVWIPADHEDAAEQMLYERLPASQYIWAWIEDEDEQGPDPRWSGTVGIVLDDREDATKLQDTLHQAGLTHRGDPEITGPYQFDHPRSLDIGERSVTVVHSLVPGGYGADDYESDDGIALRITITDDGEELGYLESNHTPGNTHIRWIQVHEPYQRQGIGRALMQQIEQYGSWDTSGYTEDGKDFIDRYRAH